MADKKEHPAQDVRPEISDDELYDIIGDELDQGDFDVLEGVYDQEFEQEVLEFAEHEGKHATKLMVVLLAIVFCASSFLFVRIADAISGFPVATQDQAQVQGEG